MASKITQIRVKCTGNDTFYSNDCVRGKILAIHVDYDADCANTTDVVVSDEYSQTFYTKSNSATDAWVYPRVQAQDNTGAGLVYISAGQPIPVEYIIFSRLKVVTTDNTAGKILKVTALVEEY